MNGKATVTYEAALARLLDCGPLKTWSLIVTILGDLAAEEGARIAGPVLSALTEPMGVKPEALRVAIHRLRRDGWITSERDGRNSLYGLTAHGRGLTRAVSGRVYDKAVAPPGEWHVVIAQTAEALQALDHPGLMRIGPKAALLPGYADHGAVQGLPATMLAWRVEPGALPDWAAAALAPEEMVRAYEGLVAALDLALGLPVPEDALQATVLRLVALHEWRRLVLRHGPGVDTLLGDWAGARARARIVALFERLARPDVAHLAVLAQGGGLPAGESAA